MSDQTRDRDLPTADLVRQLSDQTSRLIHGDRRTRAGDGHLARGADRDRRLGRAVAAAMALLGKSRVQEALPPVPEDSVESVKEDVQWTKTKAQEGRR